MAARYCSSCGAPLAAGAQFCTFCGTAVPSAPLASTPSAPPAAPEPPPPPMAYPSSYAPSSPPPKRTSRARIVVVVLVVLLLVGGIAIVALAFLPGPSNQVQIQEIDIWAPDNACGLNANPIGFSGYNDTPGDVDQLELSMPNYNTTQCSIVGLATNSSGFAVSNLSLPLTIPGSPNPGNPTSENLNLTLSLPNSAFDGVVNLVVR